MAEPIWKRGANAGEIRVVESIDRAIQLYERWIAEGAPEGNDAARHER